jgi:polysaccharide export outer membrane protein
MLTLLVTVLLAGCQTTNVASRLPKGDEAYKSFPSPSGETISDYLIGPLDIISVTVFKEPDLSLKDLQVDASGNVSFPLIGDIRAAGKSAKDLSREIASRLNEQYFNQAQVSVVVTASISQHITVEGNVVQPGVYDVNGSQTLLQAIAQAKSPTRTARLDQIVVFRFIDGKRTGAVFNLKDIREGKAPDPALRGGDIVVVGFSGVKGAFRDFLTAAPIIGLFRVF